MIRIDTSSQEESLGQSIFPAVFLTPSLPPPSISTFGVNSPHQPLCDHAHLPSPLIPATSDGLLKVARMNLIPSDW